MRTGDGDRRRGTGSSENMWRTMGRILLCVSSFSHNLALVYLSVAAPTRGCGTRYAQTANKCVFVNVAFAVSGSTNIDPAEGVQDRRHGSKPTWSRDLMMLIALTSSPTQRRVGI